MGGWFRKEVKSPADIKGLKFRVGGFAGRVIERMGGVPQNIPGGEIYQSLEKGTIDAAEWIGPYDDLKLGFNKVAPYYYYPGWWEGSLNLEFYVNQKALAALTPEQRAIVQAAAHEAHVVTQGRYDARNPGALKQLVAAKAKVLPFPQSVMDASFKASMELYAELDKSNPEWKKIYADYRNFQRDQILWSRFAESRFDNYMASQKL
ncbi:Alpha-keto acid-binding periplasmic protein TakP precursor [compost metagenome]